jgi:predicted transcriptional regulator
MARFIKTSGLKPTEIVEFQIALALFGEMSVSAYMRAHVRSIISAQKELHPHAFRRVHPHHSRVLRALDELGSAYAEDICKQTRLSYAETGAALRHLTAVNLIEARTESVIHESDTRAGRPRKIYRLTVETLKSPK